VFEMFLGSMSRSLAFAPACRAGAKPPPCWVVETTSGGSTFAMRLGPRASLVKRSVNCGSMALLLCEKFIFRPAGSSRAVVLTDIIMPEKEGIAFIRELRPGIPRKVKIVAIYVRGRNREQGGQADDRGGGGPVKAGLRTSCSTNPFGTCNSSTRSLMVCKPARSSRAPCDPSFGFSPPGFVVAADRIEVPNRVTAAVHLPGLDSEIHRGWSTVRGEFAAHRPPLRGGGAKSEGRGKAN